MKRYAIISILIVGLVFVLSACGRQLEDITTPPPPPPTEVTDADDTDDTDTDADAGDADDASDADDADADDEDDTDADADADDVDDAGDADSSDDADADNGDADADDRDADTSDADPPGNKFLGEVLFNEMRTEVNFACGTCHYVDSTDRLIGPGLLGIGETAATRVEGQDAVTYLRNSITNPDEHVIEDYTDDLMPETYTEFLEPQQIEDLIAYLLDL